MASAIDFKFTGVDKLVRNMRIVGPEIATKAGASAVRAGANHMRKAISAAAPVGDDDTSRTYTVKGGTETVRVDYGHLKDNIRVRKGKPRKEYNQVATVSTGNAFWGYMLEFGTEKMRPHPFFGAAFEANTVGALEVIQKQLNRYLERQLKKMGL